MGDRELKRSSPWVRPVASGAGLAAVVGVGFALMGNWEGWSTAVLCVAFGAVSATANYFRARRLNTPGRDSSRPPR